MGRKLGGYGKQTPFVHVRGKDGEFFIGKLITRRVAGKFNTVWYEFEVEDTDMTVTMRNEAGVDEPYQIAQKDRVSFSAPTILDKALQMAMPGEKIKFVYKGLGEKKGGRNAPHLYDAEVVD